MALHCSRCGHRFLSGAGGVCYNCERIVSEEIRYGRRRPARPVTLHPTNSETSLEHTLRLHRQGLSPEAIAEARALEARTVYGHLGKLVEQGLLNSEEVLSRALALEIECAYRELAYPRSADQVAALLPRRIPVDLVAYALGALRLKLGGGRRLVQADLSQARGILKMARGQCKLPAYELVRLLQARKAPGDQERQLFGIFWGYDRDQILELVAALDSLENRLEVAS